MTDSGRRDVRAAIPDAFAASCCHYAQLLDRLIDDTVAGGGGAVRRAWALLALDSATGAATLPVAVLAADGPDSVVSRVSLEDMAAIGWRARFAEVDPAEAADGWVEEANGVTWDLVELDPPGTPDLRGDAEALVDDLLGEAGS